MRNDGEPARGRTFERTLAAVGPLLDWLEGIGGDLAVPPDAMRALQLAVEEVFANCVRHNAGGAGPIEVRVEAEGARVRVAIVDPDADRFDPRLRGGVRADLPLEEREPGGLGIPLIREIVDDIEYEHHGRRGVTVLVKTVR